MSNSDFDADIFLQIGKLLHKQDTEDAQKKSIILEDAVRIVLIPVSIAPVWV